MEPNETKIESKVDYDERRKKLTHITKEEKKTEYGSLVIESKGVYHEEGIRKILGNLEERKKVIEKNVETLKEWKDPINFPEPRDTELTRLKENLKSLQLMDHKEKASTDDLKKEYDDLKKNLEDLKNVDKDISDIKKAIGSRLKLG